MSVRWITAVYSHRGLDLVTKAVLLAIADSASDHGHCFPSISHLAEKTGGHRATIIRAVERLEAGGYIRADRSNGRQTQYWITEPHNWSPIATGSGEQPVAESSATGRTERPHRSHRATKPVAQSDTNRKEPSITVKEPSGRGSRLPRDWRPNRLPEDLQSEINLWPPGKLERELSRFRDYWSAAPGAKGVKRDWDATWRNWIRRTLDDEQQRGGFGRSPSGSDQKPGRLETAAAATAGAIEALRRRQGGGGF